MSKFKQQPGTLETGALQGEEESSQSERDRAAILLILEKKEEDIISPEEAMRVIKNIIDR